MTIVHRRLIYLFFITTFLIVGPLIALYATGYRYNTRLGVVQRTGAVMMDVLPREGVRVYLDGVHKEDMDSVDRTIRLTRLTPKEYSIRVEKEGYHSWGVVTDVGASETVFFPHVHLFREDIFPVFIDQEEPARSPFTATSTVTEVRGVEVQLVPGTNHDQIVQSKTAFTSSRVIGTIPHAADYVFRDAPDRWIVLEDVDTQILYLFLVNDDGASERQFIIPNVEQPTWSSGQRYILYHNDFELRVFDTQSGSNHLITRRSSGISRALWHPEGGYIIYQTENSIRAHEFAERQDIVSHELISLPDIQDMRISEEGDTLFLRAHIGSQRGWFSLQIQ